MIPVRSYCLLIGRNTPDALFGYPCRVMWALHLPQGSRYTVLMQDGRILRCAESSLLPIDPQPYHAEAWRVANSRITKDSPE
jgi:hypothetical protein